MIYAKTYNCKKEPWLLKNKPAEAIQRESEAKDIYRSDKENLKIEIDNLMKETYNVDINEYTDTPENLVNITLQALKLNENILIKNGYLKNSNNDYFIKYDYLLKEGNNYNIFIILYKSLEKALKDYSSKATLIPKYLYTKDILSSVIQDKDADIKVYAINLVEKEFIIEPLKDENFNAKDLDKILYEELNCEENKCTQSRKCKKCQYRDYCGVPNFSVADLEMTPNCWRIIDPIIKANNSLNVEDLTQEQINTLKPYQLARYEANMNKNGIYINKEIINNFLDKISKKGYISFDFETYSSLIAFNDKYKNYSQIPFSYSYDLVDGNGHAIEHRVFVVDYKENNFDSLVQKLIEDVPIDLPIVVYYKEFETTRLKELQELNPDLKDILQKYIDNIVDLYEVFSSGGYYDVKFNNSLSLKSVYPTLCESNDYENLDINHGDDCAIQYKELFNSKKEDGADVLINQIEKYNSKDTMAQIEIIEKLKKITNYNNC